MHKVDLSKYNVRSDLIIESESKDYIKDSYDEEHVHVDYIQLDNKNVLKKKKGDYITISFQDITDSNNFNKVLNVLNKELKRILELTKIKSNFKCLIIGLGNNKSTPDPLGHESL